METSLLIGPTIFVVGTGITVLMASAAAISYGAQKLEPRDRHVQWFLYGLIGVWFAVALIPAISGQLSFETLPPYALIPIIGGTLLSFWRPLRNLIRAIPSHWLIYIQAYRIAGAVFLYLYFAEGALTRGFALNAGIGDVITGVLALPVGWMVMRQMRGSGIAFVLWTLFGIGDLIVAPASAFVYGGDGLETFPVSFVPLFLGPPFGILIHIMTARNFWLQRQQQKVNKAQLSSSGYTNTVASAV